MKIELTKTCPFCGAETRITVEKEQYDAWQSGTLIQKAFPGMDADNREIVKTGICLKCQKDIFG